MDLRGNHWAGKIAQQQFISENCSPDTMLGKKGD
jgi:hypothetical protein